MITWLYVGTPSPSASPPIQPVKDTASIAIFVCIHIYVSLSLSLSFYIHIYIYIHISFSLSIYIYIYTYATYIYIYMYIHTYTVYWTSTINEHMLLTLHLNIRPFFILSILRPRIFESKFRDHCAKKLDGALRKSTFFV